MLQKSLVLLKVNKLSTTAVDHLNKEISSLNSPYFCYAVCTFISFSIISRMVKMFVDCRGIKLKRKLNCNKYIKNGFRSES